MDSPVSVVPPTSGNGSPRTSAVLDPHSPKGNLNPTLEPQATLDPQATVDPQPTSDLQPQPTPDLEPQPDLQPTPDLQPLPDRQPLASAQLETGPAPAAPSPSPTFQASAALDQAFAPLEIAFPPLPMVDRREVPPASIPPAAVAPPPLEVPSLLVNPALESFTAPGFPGEPPLDSPTPPLLADDGNGGGLDEVDGDGELNLDDGPPRGDFEVGAAAAPVPSFHVDGPPGMPPVASRASLPPEDSATTDAPVAKSLAAWRAWLPGAFRSRPRS